MIEKIKADKFRWHGKKHIFALPQFRFVYVKRHCEHYRDRNKLLFLFWRLIYQHMEIKYNMDVPAKVKIGKGLRIEHIGGLVINPLAELGENITLLNGVLIGSQSRGKRMGTPIIGDEVWIGTNSVIVGGINIGKDCLIAPGAYVNFNVPAHSIVLGNPGKIIPKECATEGYILNKYEYKSE